MDKSCTSRQKKTRKRHKHVRSTPPELAGSIDSPTISWDEQFPEHRKISDRRSHVEWKRGYNSRGDDLELFCQDAEDTTGTFEVEEWKKFCHGVTLSDVENGVGAAGEDRIVWLDDRTSGGNFDPKDGGKKRKIANPLTAQELQRTLAEPRFDHKMKPDAARRLVYISDLSPGCIHALASTASSHQTPVLRKAIHKYLSFQTSIGFNTSPSGLIFQLDLHLPFFMLKKETAPEKTSGDGNLTIATKRDWTNLSFLGFPDGKTFNSEGKDQGPEGMEVWGLHEAQISCVVTGSDDSKWVAYGFVDAEIDGILAECDEEDLRFDPITSRVFEVHTPIWRPRDYWIKVLEIRIGQVRKEWDDILYFLEKSVDIYIKEHPFTLSKRPETAPERSVEMKKAFDWTVQAMALLDRVSGVLADTVEAWETFKKRDFKEMGYSRNSKALNIIHALKSLKAIRNTFQELQNHQKRLKRISESCSGFSKRLALRLNVESKEVADQSGSTSELTVSVLYPIALAAAIFSMQPGAIPFDLTARSFVLTIGSMIVMVYIIRFVNKRALSCWPLMQTTFAKCMKKERMRDFFGGGESSVLQSWFGVGVPTTSSAYGDRISAIDQERVLGTSVLRGHGNPIELQSIAIV
ncbi:hypothetical protein BKA61DRAFT_662501 [Leptodontidium sp. MPI-SDFR-AT-0119]|nr:hypothetical protein BKA61DRAFT_662501 [Leptodontidium sp. MPI-SDFR-AT-0119]